MGINSKRGFMKREKKKKRPRGGYDNTTTIAELTYPKDGVRSEGLEEELEINDRPYEKLTGLAYGMKPLGRKWTGKKFLYLKNSMKYSPKDDPF